MSWKFEEGDEVSYDHPKHGRGRGTVEGFNKDQSKLFIVPKNKSVRKKCDCLVCSPDQVVLTPF
jgi:hypothetical protein